MNDTLTAIDGLAVGHWTDSEARTGCTVILCPPEGCLASGLVLGAAPGTRESALLAPDKSVDRIHAVLLTGGSAFGLAAADGVVRWLEAQGRGYYTPAALVPIVPAAVLYDLAVGRADVRPDAEAGWAAAEAASSDPVVEGSVGAGTGATVGKLGGNAPDRGGLGSALIEVDGAKVAAVAISNAIGSLVDPDGGEVVAGPPASGAGAAAATNGTNTTLVAVATDAKLDKGTARALAQSAHIGIARVTRPSHTPFDGDSTFVLSTEAGLEPKGRDLFSLAVAVQDVVAAALLRGVRAAHRAR